MSKKDSDIAKGIAILCMIFHHLFGTRSRFTEYVMTGLICDVETTVTVANVMKICVAMFAFLSGYGMYISTVNAEGKQGRLSLRWFCKTTLIRYWGLIKDVCILLPLMIVISKIFHFSRLPIYVWKNGGRIKEIKGLLTNLTGTAGIFNYKWFVNSWWYLSIAVLFIFLFPFIYILMRKLWSMIPLVIVCVIPFVFHVKAHHDNVWRYLPAFVLGMFIADIGLIGIIKKWIASNYLRYVIVGVSIIALFAITYYCNHLTGKHFIFQSVEALLVIMAATLFISGIPAVSSGLDILGRNSKYMWLTHVYIYGQVLGEKLFALKNIWIIWTVLLIISLVVSVILKKCTDTIYAYIERIFEKIKSA